MGVGIARRDDETWLEAALRRAKPYGLEHEVAEHYHAAIQNGYEPDEAAFHACMEWDVCDLLPLRDED